MALKSLPAFIMGIKTLSLYTSSDNVKHVLNFTLCGPQLKKGYKNKEYAQRGKCPESRLLLGGRPTMKTLNHARIQVTLCSAHLVSH